MKAKASATALKLLNLYRQAHVIVGGWTALNPIFIAEANDDVLKELRELPTGKNLVQHIENLRSGKTQMDSIDRDLLPYGGMMGDATPPIILTQAQWKELESGLEFFTPDQSGLNAFLTLDVKVMVEEMIEVTDYLENQNGYGFFGFGKRHRMMQIGRASCRERV